MINSSLLLEALIKISILNLNLNNVSIAFNILKASWLFHSFVFHFSVFLKKYLSLIEMYISLFIER